MTAPEPSPQRAHAAAATGRPPGISIVIPVKDGSRSLDAVLDAIAAERAAAEAAGRAVEVIAVDDGSRDGSREILEARAARGDLEILDGGGRGASAAINAAIGRAHHPLIAQIDQDVVVHRGWLESLAAHLEEPGVAAAQGCYRTDPSASALARVMGMDLEQRYGRIGPRIDHVCTGNSLYRADALRSVGLLDEGLGYGADVDLSYRLRLAGHRLVLEPCAGSTHRWREGLAGYARQQYGFGYGRLDVLARHPRRIAGDDVAPTAMMMHAPAMLVAIALASLAMVVGLAGGPWTLLLLAGAAIVAALASERLVAGIRAWRRFRDPVALLFPAAHLLRDLAWSAAIVAWTARRMARRPGRPHHSMVPGS